MWGSLESHKTVLIRQYQTHEPFDDFKNTVSISITVLFGWCDCHKNMMEILFSLDGEKLVGGFSQSGNFN